MKTKFFLGLAALALMTSCSNDESIDMAPQTNAISFENVFVDKAGRALDLNKDNLPDFGVYGFMESAAGTVFNNERVYKNGTDWKYDNTQYWTAGKDYWFSAIAPYTNNWTFAPTISGGTIKFNNQATAANGEEDLLYAYSGLINCSDPAAQTPVAFTFEHLLSRVKFSFENGMRGDYTKLVVSAITITDAYNTGTIDMNLAAPAWDVTASAQSPLVFGDVAEIGRDETLSCDHKYLIPASKAYKVTFTVTRYQGDLPAESYNHTVDLPAVDMLKGYSYNFKARFTGENINPGETLYPIVFDVTEVKEWEEFEEKPVTLP